MAILKIIAHGHRREAKRKVIQYVLDNKKTQEDLSYVTGDFQEQQITPKTVFNEFQRVRQLFQKDNKGSRTYLHGTVSFAPGELPPDQVKDFAVELMEQIYPREQLIELNLQYKIMNRLIRGAATNINQLTRIANTTNAVPAAKLLIDMYQDVRIIKDNLQPLWEEIRRMAWRS